MSAGRSGRTAGNLKAGRSNAPREGLAVGSAASDARGGDPAGERGRMENGDGPMSAADVLWEGMAFDTAVNGVEYGRE